MSRKIIIMVIIFTAFVSILFIRYNPNLATDLTDDYADGEVFLPVNNHYEFKTFTMKSTARNFTAKRISNGHIMLVDDTGDKTINVIDFNNMINSQKDEVDYSLAEELKKPG